MAVSKVILNSTTLMDATTATAAAADIMAPKTAMLADGVMTTGTGSGGVGNWTLIGTKVFSNVAEYTDTSTVENMDTEINIQNTDYAWGYVVITCDAAITTSTEWGMTVSFWGRYTSNGALFHLNSTMQKGVATLSKAAMISNSQNSGSYGVWINNNTTTVVLGRKCHGTGCPKIRAGNYTVKVYGMTAF